MDSVSELDPNFPNEIGSTTNKISSESISDPKSETLFINESRSGSNMVSTQNHSVYNPTGR